MTPGQTARQWAAENRSAEGLLTVESITPKGRGGWGRATRRTQFYLQAGTARMKGSRRIDDPQWRRGTWATTHSHNGSCYRCGQLFLEPVLRLYHVPNPSAGQPATHSYNPNAVQFRYGIAYLCPHCATPEDLSCAEFHERGLLAEVCDDPGLYQEWLHHPWHHVPDLGTIAAA